MKSLRPPNQHWRDQWFRPLHYKVIRLARLIKSTEWISCHSDFDATNFNTLQHGVTSPNNRSLIACWFLCKKFGYQSLISFRFHARHIWLAWWKKGIMTIICHLVPTRMHYYIGVGTRGEEKARTTKNNMHIWRWMVEDERWTAGWDSESWSTVRVLAANQSGWKQNIQALSALWHEEKKAYSTVKFRK